jgi:hypothetical protein
MRDIRTHKNWGLTPDVFSKFDVDVGTKKSRELEYHGSGPKVKDEERDTYESHDTKGRIEIYLFWSNANPSSGPH